MHLDVWNNGKLLHSFFPGIVCWETGDKRISEVGPSELVCQKDTNLVLVDLLRIKSETKSCTIIFRKTDLVSSISPVTLIEITNYSQLKPVFKSFISILLNLD